MNTDGTIPHGAVIIGAGQAGLAMSRALSARGVDHLLLERGAVGHAWRTARWDSLTMLTPNWANALPGAPYDGNAPDGFMTASAFSWRLDRYAHAIGAPVQDRTEVCAVRRDDAGYRIETTSGPVLGRSLVIASGACAQAAVPAISKAVPPGVLSTTPARYRRPSDLPPGGVLVVGASASGVQIARELQRSGRHVTISVGNHIRLPRHYRGRDIEGWLDAIGLLDERAEQIEDLARARQMPSPQLQGGPDAVDLNALQAIGVEVVGRLTDIRDGRALFSGGLHHLVAGADLKMARLLDQIDHWVHDHGHESALPPPDRPPPTRLPAAPALSLPLGGGVSSPVASPVSSIVWATGFKPDLGWLTLPVFDRRGRLDHRGGVLALPGLYALGLPLLRRRRSHQISGVGGDAEALSHHLRAHLDGRPVAAA